MCPHGHVDPRLFSDEHYSFGSPADLFIIPDHYVFRMLYSHGVPLERLGIGPDKPGRERNHRNIWQIFAENFHLFQATPSGSWLAYELNKLFGVEEKPSAQNAQAIYDHIVQKLALPEFRPRRLFETFSIEVCCALPIQQPMA